MCHNSMQKYSVNQFLINNLLTFIQTGQIAIPEIQRPFVWSTVKVRDLMDSLYKGFPIGYIIAWKNPDVKLKDGTLSKGKMVLIDGQQRITALNAAILGQSVVDKDYRKIKIRISFNPITEEFATRTPAIEKNSIWIPDISQIMTPEFSTFKFVKEYCEKNNNMDEEAIGNVLTRLRDINNKQVGFIELAEDLDIETVTEIFIRINSEWVPLSQADFAMSKIASHGDFGINLRKCVDYFCHLAREPKFFDTLAEVDEDFGKTEYLSKIAWLKNVNDDLYDPDYSDVIRVAFTKEFNRGKLSELVSLLSGRNFETREFEQEIMEASYKKLQKWVLNFVNKTNFERFVMIIKSAGFITPKLIRSQNTLNFAYILYLKLKEIMWNEPQIERYVRKRFVMSILTGRYSWSPESKFDFDIKHIVSDGIEYVLNNIEQAELSDAFWYAGLVSNLNRAVSSSPYINVFRASQIMAGDKWFLSDSITVESLIEHRGDIHHTFPKEFLKQRFTSRSDYNQIANYVFTQSEVNIKIWKHSPQVYLDRVKKQIDTKVADIGAIVDGDRLMENFRQNCIPETIFEMTIDSYPEFLEQRRTLMANKMKEYYFGL